jgi:hypothetical protein
MLDSLFLCSSQCSRHAQNIIMKSFLKLSSISYLLHIIHSPFISEKNFQPNISNLHKACKNPGRQLARETTFLSLVSNACCSSVRNTFYVTLLTP